MRFKSILAALALAFVSVPALAAHVPHNHRAPHVSVNHGEPTKQTFRGERPDFREYVAMLGGDMPAMFKQSQVQEYFQKIQSVPFNAYSISTLGGNCGVQGTIMFQTLHGQSVCLAVGTSGQVLISQGPAADLKWQTITGTGTVTSVGMTVPVYMAVSGSPITGAGSFGLSFGTEANNQFFAGPATGGPLAPTFRSIAASDIPATLNATAFAGGISSTGAAAGITTADRSVAGNLVMFRGAGIDALFDTVLGANIAAFTEATSQWAFPTNSIPGADLNNASVTNTQLGVGAAIANIGTNGLGYTNFVQGAAASLTGNPTGATANQQNFTINGLTDISAIVAADEMLVWQSSTGTFKRVTLTELIAAIPSGVPTVFGRSGAIAAAFGDYTSQQIQPIISGTPPAAGRIGEILPCTGTTALPAGGGIANLCSISLTVGSWDCAGMATAVFPAITTPGRLWISLTSATDPGSPNAGGYSTVTPSSITASVTLTIGRFAVDISAPASIFLEGAGNGGGSASSTNTQAMSCERKA